MRTKIGAAAVTVAAMGSLLAGTASTTAQAMPDGNGAGSTSRAAETMTDYEKVDCTRDQVTSSWVAGCARAPVDGDAGGVSGYAHLYNERSERWADIEFSALGEKVYLRADAGTTTNFGVYYWAAGEWVTAYQHTDWDGDVDETIDLNLDDGTPIHAAVCIRRAFDQCAGLGTMRS
ncbi:hypothetical protein [Solicola gregarius]|uniref:Secreted protein n=1 Tax=Solicola gregarius TaxID=2908642 RepID=A0AA46YM14_9ACTN|nr:hypothetical protein [Solicola gregarius]UYM06179.1 hypothetical protein L0C25_03640 [Solicola gregarius]